MASGLRVQLDAPLPDQLAVGAGTALFVCGWCVAPAGPIAELTFVVDGAEQPVAQQGMPRLDVLRALHPSLDPFALHGVTGDPSSADDPGIHGYRCGFWGTVRVARSSAASCRIELRARLDSGDHVSATLATIPIVELPTALPVPDGVPGDGPLVAICMATYEPSLDLLQAQLDSIRAQTHERWVCIISDDCSSAERLDEIRAATGGDPRFVVDRSSQRRGFYRNFERALALAPVEAEFVALSDQDDAWDPDKLETLLATIGDARLVYSDARIVGRDGARIADTYWQDRDNNYEDLFSLLVANSVTGAASLFVRELLADALPFPPAQFAHYHDHWLGLVALSLGDIAYVDRPLYDYVQHGDASLGHAAATEMRSLRSRVARLRTDPRERVRAWRAWYFVDVARLTQVVTVLQLRCADRMAPGKRRALDRFLRTDESIGALARLWARGARELVGRPETLGAEWTLASAFTWRRLLTAVARDHPVRALRIDAVPPAAFVPSPGGAVSSEPEVREVALKIAPLRLAITDDAPARINILIPSVDLKHFFGGYIAKFNLALRLARRGLRVRVVTVDRQAPLPSAWMAQLEAYDGLAGLSDLVEVGFGRETTGLEVSRNDRFIATTWWSAHIAHAAAQSLRQERFLYLIQEYEPFTFPMSTYAALADGSYTLPHVAVFSTELLRDYFRRQGIGVYSDGEAEGDRMSLSFQNAITDVPAPSADELAQRSTRRLLFYARPEPHAARNLFELGVLALGRARDLGAFRGGWELCGIGTVTGGGGRLDIGGGTALQMVPRAHQRSYAELLRGFDVGLSLMYTPHPSLVPIEMAAAGMLTVTNTCANKTAAAMAAISENLITVAPSVEALADALAGATAAIDDSERRARGSNVAWSRSWDESFDAALLDQVAAWLE